MLWCRFDRYLQSFCILLNLLGWKLIFQGSVEEKIYQRQVSKTGLSGVVVDAKTDSKLHFTPADLRVNLIKLLSMQIFFSASSGHIA